MAAAKFERGLAQRSDTTRLQGNWAVIGSCAAAVVPFIDKPAHVWSRPALPQIAALLPPVSKL